MRTIIKRDKTVWNCISFLCDIHFLCSNPPSLKTNRVIPKQIRNEPVVISTLYIKAYYPVCRVRIDSNNKIMILKIFIKNILSNLSLHTSSCFDYNFKFVRIFDIHGGAHIAVPEPFLDLLHWHALGE